jgi:hypothetical protein
MHEIHDQLNCRWHHSHRDFIILNTHWTVEVSSKLLWRFGIFFPELNNVLMRMIFWYWADSPRQRRRKHHDAQWCSERARAREFRNLSIAVFLETNMLGIVCTYLGFVCFGEHWWIWGVRVRTGNSRKWAWFWRVSVTSSLKGSS